MWRCTGGLASGWCLAAIGISNGKALQMDMWARMRLWTERLRERRQKWSRYQGVTAFVGMPGGGKSYGLAEMAGKAIRAGLPVYSNAGFDVKGSRILESFDEFASVRGPALIVWDELPLYFNSRKWAEFPDGMLYKFTQIRKDGLRLAYSTIHEDMVDVNIRRVTFWYWHCNAVTRTILRRSLWPPAQFRKANAKPYAKEWVRVKRSVYDLYDTGGKVAVQADVAENIDRVSDEGFVIPALGQPVRGARGSAAPTVGGGAVLVRPAIVPGSEGDPWGLPVADPVDLGRVPDEGLITMDRSSWPRA